MDGTLAAAENKQDRCLWQSCPRRGKHWTADQRQGPSWPWGQEESLSSHWESECGSQVWVGTKESVGVGDGSHENSIHPSEGTGPLGQDRPLGTYRNACGKYEDAQEIRVSTRHKHAATPELARCRHAGLLLFWSRRQRGNAGKRQLQPLVAFSFFQN